MTDLTGEVLVLLGSLFMLLAGIGVLRFGDVFVRMHALSKASTLGLLLVLLGAAIALEHPNDVTSLVLAAVLHLVTSPIGNNVLSRATYVSEAIPTDPEPTEPTDVGAPSP
jgi:multicomponent Na+:H+ antiporter subunit G